MLARAKDLEDTRPQRNTLACAAGLSLILLASVGLEHSARPGASLLRTLASGVDLSSTTAFGPLAGVVDRSSIPDPVAFLGAAISWGIWMFLLARGLAKNLPWIVHALLPIAWCVIGAVAASLAALAVT